MTNKKVRYEGRSVAIKCEKCGATIRAYVASGTESTLHCAKCGANMKVNIR
jgi:uncharacterized Zn finger protein